MGLLDDLNPEQREAVEATEGPVLVLAGAGTGKTRVITYRIAYLLARGVPPNAVLAITFTNKAADEMRQRVAALLGSRPGGPWVGTFHAFAAWLLRQDGPRIGLARTFAIYDEEDQARLLRRALEETGHSEGRWPARELREIISRAKNTGQPLAELAETAPDELTRVAARVFPVYQRLLAQAGALDFDDLLLRVVALLADTSVRRRWNDRFRYLLVDEYQDINPAQRELVLDLAGPQRNVCVVGDEDQSIYRWRGADPELFLRFQRDFPEARLIRLERNYRSPQTILDAAGAVVAHNSARIGKHLRAVRPGGPQLRLYCGADPQDEAGWVVGELARLLAAEPDARLAVLYRTAFQSRPFEEHCQRLRLRYRVLGGFSFYRRAEVKDLVAYLRLALHPEDDAALERVLNTPPRGIGEATLERLRRLAAERRVPLWAVLPEAGGRAAAALERFRRLIEELRAAAGTCGPAVLLRQVLERTGYLDWLEQRADSQPADEERAGNVRELLAALDELERQGEPLETFLDRISLVSEADAFDPSIPVTLMTLHSAKGLEFDHVFIAGLEEGLLPHARSARDPVGLEEERRLFYVGMTRARRTLTLTLAARRRSFESGSFTATSPSRFLAEIPSGLLEPVVREAEAFSHAWPLRNARLDGGAEFVQVRPARRRPPTARFAVGTRVRHPTLGIGTILEIEDDGEDRKITVSFTDHGVRKLIERYAGLQPA
jgi:DNA helicase-2/ATP-dependent DNA helicase PcrA